MRSCITILTSNGLRRKEDIEIAYMANSSLNLNSDETPLTYSKALRGEDREAWLLEHDAEMRKLISGTHTMHPINKNRQRDITYFIYPVCAEKKSKTVKLNAESEVPL